MTVWKRIACIVSGVGNLKKKFAQKLEQSRLKSEAFLQHSRRRKCPVNRITLLSLKFQSYQGFASGNCSLKPIFGKYSFSVANKSILANGVFWQQFRC